MRSVFFISLMNSDSWGGSEEIWFQSAIYLSQKGGDVGVCFFDWPGKEKKIELLSQAGCKIFLLPGRNEARSFLKKLKLKKSIRDLPINDYDEVIINQGGWKDIVHGPFKKIYTRCKNYSIIYHNYGQETLSRRKLQLFDKWVTNAKTNIGAAKRIFSAIAEWNSLVIPNQQILFNPITFKPPHQFSPFLDSVNDSPNFIVLAQLDKKRKAQDILIRSLSGEKWKKRNWQLFLYGKGNDASLIKQMIETSGLEKKIFLKGYTQDIPGALSWSHVLLQITHIDAMPISVTEAMAMSRPVIASNVGDMPLWIKDDANGWIVNEVSVEGIDAALEKVWQNRNRLEAMGKESFNTFAKKYPEDPVIYFLAIAGIQPIN